MTRKVKAPQGHPFAAEIVPASRSLEVPLSSEDARRSQIEAEDARAWLAKNPVVIESEGHFTKIGALMRVAVMRKKELEAARKRITDPLEKAKKEVFALFRPATDAWGEVERLLKGPMSAWQLQQDEARRAAELNAQKAARKGDTAQLHRAIEKADATAPAKADGVSTRFRWVLKRVVPDLVPRDWMTPDIERARMHAQAAGSAAEIDPVPGFIFEREAIIGGSKS